MQEVNLSEKSEKNLRFVCEISQEPPQTVLKLAVVIFTQLYQYRRDQHKLIAFKGDEDKEFSPPSINDYDDYCGHCKGSFINTADIHTAVSIIQKDLDFPDIIQYEIVIGVGLKSLVELITMKLNGYQFHIRNENGQFIEKFDLIG